MKCAPKNVTARLQKKRAAARQKKQAAQEEARAAAEERERQAQVQQRGSAANNPPISYSVIRNKTTNVRTTHTRRITPRGILRTHVLKCTSNVTLLSSYPFRLRQRLPHAAWLYNGMLRHACHATLCHTMPDEGSGGQEGAHGEAEAGRRRSTGSGSGSASASASAGGMTSCSSV